MNDLHRIDIIVNNAAEQHPKNSLEEITDEQLERTFRTNIFSMFYLVREALPHLKEGAAVINTNSVTSYAGNPQLIDYSSTKGAITSFTRSLALNLASRKIRVNQLAEAYVFLASDGSTYMTGQTLHINGGEIING